MHTLVGNKLVDRSATTSSFSTSHLPSIDWAKQLHDETRNIYALGFDAHRIRGVTVYKLPRYVITTILNMHFIIKFWEKQMPR